MALDVPTIDSLGGQCTSGPHTSIATEGATSSQVNTMASPKDVTPAGRIFPNGEPMFITPWPEDVLADIGACAAVFDDIEKIRIANENRLRQFTRPKDQVDKDGKHRGYGWTITNVAVQKLAAQVLRMKCDSTVALEALGERKPPKHLACCLEDDAERNLTRALRAHPLGTWVLGKEQKGIGPKQGARLLGVIGDPYVRPEMKTTDGEREPMRPRTIDELRAYCGYGEDKSRPGRIQKRRRGQRSNWNGAAKMRAYLVAKQCMISGFDKKRGCVRDEGDDFATHSSQCQCSPYRLIYDRERVRYADAVHDEECPQCGPEGRPAQPGSPLSQGHKKNRALRRVAKEILDDLWREARRIHLETPVGGQMEVDTHRVGAVDGANP